MIEKAKGANDEQNNGIPIVATGHLTALGVSQSESVRDIYIGTLEGFDARGFPPADYIALGHIHRPQKVAKNEHIRYSGSPIPLSFDELNTQKQVVLVEFTSQSTSPCISTLPVPRFQPMEVIKGDLQAIEKAINASEAIAQASKIDSINGADTDSNKSTVWLCIEVETQDYLSDLQQRVQQFLEGKNAEILQLKRVRQRTAKSLSETQNVQLSELSVKDVFEARLALASLDETPADTVTEAIEPQSKSTPLSRIDRIRHLFSDAVELVHTNKEDLANKEETEPLSTLSGSASASEQNQATQGEA